MDYFSDQNNALLMKIPRVFLLFPLLIFGCDLINPSDPVPSYISVERILIDSFRNEPNSADIPDVWVSIDGKYQGTYEVNVDDPTNPLTFPVLKEGENVEVTINGGILRDYILGRHDPYVFYEEYTVTVPLRKTEVTVINPRIGYKEEADGGIKFPSLAFENFESTSFRRYIPCSQCNIPMQEVDPDTLNGGPEHGDLVAYFEIDSGSKDAIGMIQRTRTTLPIPPTTVFLELDYNSNIGIFVGLQVNGGGVWNIIQLLPTFGNFQKVYLFITDDIGTVGGLDPTTEYAVFIASEISDGEEKKYASFDNLRIVHPN